MLIKGSVVKLSKHLSIPFFMLLLLQGNCYAAKVRFGDKESIRFVQETTVPTPSGEKLYLGRRVLMKQFVLPYLLVDNGYVLGVTGTNGDFYNLPQGDELKVLQLQGHLPNPLPEYQEDWFSLLIGHSLWILIGGLLVWFGIAMMLKKKRSAGNERSVGDERSAM
jgi:hypothetical protein